ncbi:MAG: nitroreductase [Deltaproteobacteria bacterium]|nr:nitroreductase [Deltaproteobacteria bacterium]
MDILEAIKTRKSIRGFKSNPVSKDILKAILEAAVHAPSAMNTQPWEFTIIAGDVLEKVKHDNIYRLRAGIPTKPEHQVVGWTKDSIYRDRQVELAKKIFRVMEIPREDKEKRADWMERGFRFFDAPVAIIIAVDRSLSDEGPLLDCGAVMQNICLAALVYGLGTCIEDQGVIYADVIREHTGLPPSKKILIAIAVGFPDGSRPENTIESDREAVDSFTTWHGFD